MKKLKKFLLKHWSKFPFCGKYVWVQQDKTEIVYFVWNPFTRKRHDMFFEEVKYYYWS